MGNDLKVSALVSRRAAVLREHSTVRTVFAGLCTGTQLQPGGTWLFQKRVLVNKSLRKYRATLPDLLFLSKPLTFFPNQNFTSLWKKHLLWQRLNALGPTLKFKVAVIRLQNACQNTYTIDWFQEVQSIQRLYYFRRTFATSLFVRAKCETVKAQMIIPPQQQSTCSSRQYLPSLDPETGDSWNGRK